MTSTFFPAGSNLCNSREFLAAKGWCCQSQQKACSPFDCVPWFLKTKLNLPSCEESELWYEILDFKHVIWSVQDFMVHVSHGCFVFKQLVCASCRLLSWETEEKNALICGRWEDFFSTKDFAEHKDWSQLKQNWLGSPTNSLGAKNSTSLFTPPFFQVFSVGCFTAGCLDFSGFLPHFEN